LLWLILFIVKWKNDLQKSKWRGRTIRYAPLFLWIGIILFCLDDTGRNVKTSRFVRPLLEFLFPNAHEETFNRLSRLYPQARAFNRVCNLAFGLPALFGVLQLNFYKIFGSSFLCF
jgi:hypothetical protein